MAYDPDPQLGATPFKLVSTGTTQDKTVVKAGAGRLQSLNVSNINAAAAHIKFYDKATVPAVASDVPVWQCAVGGGTAGVTFSPNIPACGINFATGIAFVIVTGAGVTNSTGVASAEVILSGSYK